MKALYRTRRTATLTLLLAWLVAALPAQAQELIPGTLPPSAERAANNLQMAQQMEGDELAPFYSESGLLTLSIDGLGTNAAGGGTIQVDKPEGATVSVAYLLAATTPFGGALNDGDVSLEGNALSWSEIVDIPFNFGQGGQSGYTDVTDIVAPIVDGAPAGLVDLQVSEPNGSSSVDGAILAVVFDDPNQTEPQTIVLSFGAQDPDGDSFAITLAEPFDGSEQSILMSLGISFSFQGGFDTQDSQIEVNGERLTSAAGGNDDGEDANGALITVGGIGDDPANPPDPFQREDGDPRYDDELYTLDPLIDDGDSQIDVTTQNPSNDDNIFFAAFIIQGATAIVGEDVLLTPVEAENPVGTEHTLTASVQNDNGDPLEDVDVDFEITSGPNAGTTSSATTNADGEAFFTYSSTETGTDVIVASFVGSEEETITSNEATKTWIDGDDGEDDNPPVCEGSLDGDTFFGSVSDNETEDDTGVFSVELSAESDNLEISVDEFTPGDPVVGYSVSLIDAEMDGSGTVVGTDGAGNTCEIDVEIEGEDDGDGEDQTPPVCGLIEVDRDAEPPTITSSAMDEESGIASITFTRLKNLDGFYSAEDGSSGSGLSEGEMISFDEEEVSEVTFGGALADPENRRVTIIVTVKNGEGLTARCDPVITEVASGVPSGFALEGNYPNPASAQTTIAFQVAEAAHVSLEVYDVLGRKVATLVDREMAPSSYKVEWNTRSDGGAPLPSGVYVYRLRAGSFTASQQMTVVR